MRLVVEVERWGDRYRWEVYELPADVVFIEEDQDAGTQREFGQAVADACLRVVTRLGRELATKPVSLHVVTEQDDAEG